MRESYHSHKQTLVQLAKALGVPLESQRAFFAQVRIAVKIDRDLMNTAAAYGWQIYEPSPSDWLTLRDRDLGAFALLCRAQAVTDAPAAYMYHNGMRCLACENRILGRIGDHLAAFDAADWRCSNYECRAYCVSLARVTGATSAYKAIIAQIDASRTYLAVTQGGRHG